MAVEFKKGGTAAAPAQGDKNLPAWMKTGKAAQEAVKEEEKKQADNQKDYGMFRVWMKPGTDARYTFLDGMLDADGVLDAPLFYEHQLNLGGHWRNWFVCVGEQEICPICEGGSKPSLVAAFTVIDHTPFTKKDGTVVKFSKKLMVVKKDTLKVFQKMAEKRGGLKGCTFDVTRTSENDASVGNMFDFTDKITKKADLIAKYGFPADFDFSPADYVKEFPYQSADELRKLGFGTSPVGGEAPLPEEPPASMGQTNYDGEL